MQQQIPGELGPILMLIILIFSVLVTLIFIAITALVYGKIFAKAGFSWALALLMVVPVVQLIMLFYLAFADWPVHRELRQLRQQCGTARA
jgi:uncharacterized membrane protein YhaH (DUF805 family)